MEMWTVPHWDGLRSSWRALSGEFFPKQPAYDKTEINFDYARQLYRNDGDETMLGGGFCRAIIDRSVDFIGLPIVSTDDEDRDAEVNDAIEKSWKPQIVEMLRNSMRDSKCVVRLWQPLATNPLVTEDERVYGRIQVYEPERVTLTYDPKDPDRLVEAIIVTKIAMRDDVQPNDPPRGAVRTMKEHEVWEIISPDNYRYWDHTDKVWLTSWERRNPYGFVPVVEVYNEYDSALSGGQSDLEAPYPFIKAFHEVTRQMLQAHAYHSTPKLKFQVSDIVSFLRNNFPTTIDENGQVIPGASISWKGREVLIMGQEDDMGFIEATSIIQDSKSLLEFLIDCVSIASATPEEMFMRAEQGVSGSSERKIIAFEKKIERKRAQYQTVFQTLVKMRAIMVGQTPVLPEIVWEETRSDTVLTMAQALQQTVMSLEVLLDRKLISENTAREGLRSFRLFRRMKDVKTEARDAKDNLVLLPPMSGDPNGGGQLPKASGQGGNN